MFERNIVMAAYQPIRVKTWGKSVDYNLFASANDVKLAQANGTDAHSLAGDPQFVAWRKGDYSVRPTSPAVKLGFANFPMDDFGVRTPRLRALAEQPQYPRPVLAPRADQRETPQAFADMMIKSVETLGEQSAAGLPTKAGAIVLTVAAGVPLRKQVWSQGTSFRLLTALRMHRGKTLSAQHRS